MADGRASAWPRRPWTSALVFLATVTVAGALLLAEAAQSGPLQAFTDRIAWLSAAAIRAVGHPVEVHDGVLTSADGTRLLVANECNGVFAHLILTAALLAHPARWGRKLGGLLLANATLFVVNLGRVVSLFALAVSAPEYFRMAHVYVWQFAIIGVALALFLVWADRAEPRPT